METGRQTEFETLDEKELDNLLTQFYPEARKKNGEKYSKSSLIGIRASISRHLTSPPFKKNFKIMDCQSFVQSNRMLFAVIKDIKKDGLDKSRHYPAINELDLAKVKESKAFNQQDAKQLQEKVFFDLQYNFGRRGRENLKNFKKSTFLFKVDDSGREYVEMSFNEATKNHPNAESLNIKTRMYSHNELDNCPIKSLRKYLSNLSRSAILSSQYRKELTKTKKNGTLFYQWG